jgi:hypothetical protein
MYRRALDIAGKEFERKVDVLKKEYFEFKTISEKKFDELAEELIKNYIIAKGEAKLAFRMAIHDVGKECEDMFSKEIEKPAKSGTTSTKGMTRNEHKRLFN